LDSLGYKNLEIHVSGELLGWPERAPYEAIIVTAGAPKIPDELVSQLVIGGRMVIPVGTHFEQELYKITRLKTNNQIINLGGCRFVPLIGKGAWNN
jgi:protein-L-isoaspartate(D-aspartate) O-methyltransferase